MYVGVSVVLMYTRYRVRRLTFVRAEGALELGSVEYILV